MGTSSVKIFNLPKLEDNRSNWNTYKERILNTLTLKGLKWHVTRTAKQPPEIELRDDGEYYKKGSVDPLEEEEVEQAETKLDEYAQKQAQVHDVIYETISQRGENSGRPVEETRHPQRAKEHGCVQSHPRLTHADAMHGQ
jgi:hypothetical protein